MSQYFENDPAVVSKPREIHYQIEAKQLVFVSDRGVFSKDHIDSATDLLIRTVIHDFRVRSVKRGTVLDLGCGIGVIGITLNRLIPPLETTMVDINRRALELAELNCRLNQIPYAEVIESDGFLAVESRKFDAIVSNPPIRAGKDKLYAFFEGARQHLNPAGRFYLVIGKKQGAASAEKKLRELFASVDVLDKSKGFFVYSCACERG